MKNTVQNIRRVLTQFELELDASYPIKIDKKLCCNCLDNIEILINRLKEKLANE